MAAVAGREELMDQFDRDAVGSDAFVPQIGTLSGNPIAAVAGLATLEVLNREGTYERLFATGSEIRLALQRTLDEAEVPAQVVGIDPLFDVFFTETDVTDYRSTLRADKRMLSRFNELLLERGILKGDDKFYVATAHTRDDVSLTIQAFASAIGELQK